MRERERAQAGSDGGAPPARQHAPYAQTAFSDTQAVVSSHCVVGPGVLCVYSCGGDRGDVMPGV